jgi:hypothetical protein
MSNKILCDISDEAEAAVFCVITALIYKAEQNIPMESKIVSIQNREDLIQYSSGILGISNDDCFLVGGYSYNYKDMFVDVTALWAEFTKDCKLSGGVAVYASKNLFGRAGYASFDFKVPWSYQLSDNLTQVNKQIFINFRGNTGYCEIRFPERSSFPAGSSYPLRKSIVTAMQRAKIKLSKLDVDYIIDFDYCAKVPRYGISRLPVNNLKVTLEGKNCSDLRKVVNHKNQYDILLDIFAKHDWLDSHEYKIVLNSKGELSKRVIIFQFKMVEQII